jgi:uncharacterized protein YyaL (SSP411 family)
MLIVALVALAACLGVAMLRRGHEVEGLGSLAAAAAGARGVEDRHRKPNRLAREKSPYLLQHSQNPVDWYPWGEEAFEKARREDKPIFLSIGYSTCHWCHVMERESFEDDSVAALLNQWFVPVKVDREERPDVDRIYMTAMQALGLGGGWPLNVFLTPGLEPFFGGTYFPPTSVPGRPGMLQLLPRIREAWVSQRADLERTGGRVLEALAGLSEPQGPGVEVDSLLDRAYREMLGSFDKEHGGFGHEPKFPSTANLNFLARHGSADPERRASAFEMVTRQLDAMLAGGIHDHLGGGFHRYSTDRTWLVPHFEKMLYDQALIAWSYLEGYQITRDERYAATARGIFAYVARDLTSQAGAFYSAEDADSEGEEGKFYVWTPAELTEVLGEEDARLLGDHYGVTPRGNFEHGTSILHEMRPLEETARAHGLAKERLAERLAAARERLLEVRSKRPRPHRDDKVLTSWNGLMIAAYARGARLLDEPAWAEQAGKAAEFVWERLRDSATGTLRRRWRDGEAAGVGQLDDYAYFARGLLDLYQATWDPVWLERSVAITAEQIERFWDEEDGAFFDSPAGDASIKVRMKDGFDGAEMAGNSIAIHNLQVLGTLLDRRDWQDKASRALDYYGRRLTPSPTAMPQMLVAMVQASATPRHVVIAGRPGSAGVGALMTEFDRRFRPHDLLLLADGAAGQKRLARLVPFVERLHPLQGKATAYVCVDYACRLPATDPRAFAAQLDAPTLSAAQESR